MESCYVPNNPNFASVDQWTPPSPTSPPVTSSAEVKQHHHHHQQQQQQQQHYTHQHHHHHHDPVIQQLCDSSDLVHSANAISSSSGNDPSSQLTSLSALPPVQELLGPCRSPISDGSVGNKDRGGDPFSSYSLTALDFEPLPGFLTLSSCASYKQHQEMADLPLSFKSGPSSHSISNYGSLYSNHHSPQSHLHQHQQGSMSPFSAAVTAATQQQQSQNSIMNGNSGSAQCQYSFHGPTSTSSQTAKMPHHHHPHHLSHHQPTSASSTPSYQESNYGGAGCGSAGIFPSMSVNVSMNMTMGMGMSMGPTMSYGIETGAPLQCWNSHNVTSGIHHLPGVATAAAAAATVTVNPNNTGYPIAPPSQALLSPIQVSYNSNIYPTSFTPSSASGYCLPGDWRPAIDPPGLYELKELKESSPSPFSSGGSSKNFAKSKSSTAVHQLSNYSTYPPVEAYPIPAGSESPVAAKKRSIHVRQSSVTPSVPSLTPTVDYDGEMASCGSGISNSSSSGSSIGLSGSGQGKANLCRVCGKTYARPSTLKTHMRTHSGERPYRCGDCHKSFSQAANLTAHVRTHSGEKPFRCQICDRRFSQSSSVTTHMRTHSGERPYRCRMCKKAFSDSSTLTKHMRIHSGEKPYQCKLCLLRFSQSGNLNRHMRVHSATS